MIENNAHLCWKVMQYYGKMWKIGYDYCIAVYRQNFKGDLFSVVNIK